MAAKTPKVTTVPSVPAYKVEADLSNVEHSEKLMALPDEHKKLLALNGFLVSTCSELDMYEIYEPNPAPFITADCVFHAYHVLLADTLSNLEEAVLAAKLESLVAAAHKASLALRTDAPAELKVPADLALTYWAIAYRLLDPESPVAPQVQEDVMSEVSRIAKAAFIGKLPGEEHVHDYTVYKPIAGYERSERMRRYFRCNRFLTLTPIKFESVEQAQECALVALALCSDKEAWTAYQDLSELSRFLSGEPDDVSPRDVVAVLRSLFGDGVFLKELAKGEPAKKLHIQLAELKRPSIADQPQDQPGADPLIGWGLRVLPPGASIRARAFQRFEEAGIPPSGEHITYLLGNKACPLDDPEATLLGPARDMVSQAAAKYDSGLDVHTSSLVALSKLSSAGGKGYPRFMSTRAWAVKTANTQLGAWSQVEHDVFLYAKDTAYYLGLYGRDVRFHGYVEPVPEYYAALATLVARTRTVFEDLNAFENIRTTKTDEPESRFERHAIVATAEHYKTLEEILLKLKVMTEKELENRPFDKSEVAFLKEFGEKLKYLAFNESNLPHAHEPMSSVVRIVREYLYAEGLYVGTGRPLQILVIVPYEGSLHWCTGAVYSYYEFMHPLSDPITDERWKRETLCAFAAQTRRPWLFRHDVGLAQRTLTRQALAKWLPEDELEYPEYFGKSYGSSVGRGMHAWSQARGMLDWVGFVKLDAEALHFAARMFAEQHRWTGSRCVLYRFLEVGPNELRKSTALNALSTIISEIEAGAAADSEDYKLWIYLSLRLLKDEWRDVLVKRKILDLGKHEKMEGVFKECIGDPDIRMLLEKAGIRVGQSQQ